MDLDTDLHGFYYHEWHEGTKGHEELTAENAKNAEEFLNTD